MPSAFRRPAFPVDLPANPAAKPSLWAGVKKFIIQSDTYGIFAPARREGFDNEGRERFPIDAPAKMLVFMRILARPPALFFLTVAQLTL